MQDLEQVFSVITGKNTISQQISGIFENGRIREQPYRQSSNQQWIHIKPMQNYLSYHLVMRSTLHCLIRVNDLCFIRNISATTNEVSGLWLLLFLNTLIMGELKPDGDRFEQAQQEVRTRNRGLTMHKRRQ